MINVLLSEGASVGVVVWLSFVKLANFDTWIGKLVVLSCSPPVDFTESILASQSCLRHQSVRLVQGMGLRRLLAGIIEAIIEVLLCQRQRISLLPFAIFLSSRFSAWCWTSL